MLFSHIDATGVPVVALYNIFVESRQLFEHQSDFLALISEFMADKLYLFATAADQCQRAVHSQLCRSFSRNAHERTVTFR